MWEEFDKWSAETGDDDFMSFLRERIKEHYEYLTSDEVKDIQEKCFIDSVEASVPWWDKDAAEFPVKIHFEEGDLIADIKVEVTSANELQFSITKVRDY